MIKQYRDDRKTIMRVALAIGLAWATLFVIPAIYGDRSSWLWAILALVICYGVGLLPRLLRLQNENGVLEAIMPWAKKRIAIKRITHVERGVGLGPYVEVRIRGRDDQGRDIKPLRLGVMNFGIDGIRELLLDLKQENPAIHFDNYTQRIMSGTK